jgi:hypothetical protein
VVFTVVDADPAIRQILTVDGRDFAIYRFAHTVDVVVPRRIRRARRNIDSTKSSRLVSRS